MNDCVQSLRKLTPHHNTAEEVAMHLGVDRDSRTAAFNNHPKDIYKATREVSRVVKHHCEAMSFLFHIFYSIFSAISFISFYFFDEIFWVFESLSLFLLFTVDQPSLTYHFMMKPIGHMSFSKCKWCISFWFLQILMVWYNKQECDSYVEMVAKLEQAYTAAGLGGKIKDCMHF